MSGFAIFNIDIKRPTEYKEYVEKVKPIAERYGGEYIVRGCLLYTSPSPRDGW